MKYIIFGGAGFLGFHLINLLKKKNIDYLSCDLHNSDDASFLQVDIRKPADFSKIPVESGDIIINLAANQYHAKLPRDKRNYFFDTNAAGVRNILEWAYRKGCKKGVLFTTDMIYGKPQYLPVDERHPQSPFGLYGQSKKEAEKIAQEYRDKGMSITIFRPRMILGPGRMGILKKLFRLIDLGLPVPLIGNGANHYQMISVFDCASAILLAAEKNFPNQTYNLGSENPPDIRTLLQSLIRETGSRSFLVPTNGALIKKILGLLEKMGLPLMHKEQYMIADEEYVVDIARAKAELGWQPMFTDENMLKEAYEEYRRKKG